MIKYKSEKKIYQLYYRMGNLKSTTKLYFYKGYDILENYYELEIIPDFINSSTNKNAYILIDNKHYKLKQLKDKKYKFAKKNWEFEIIGIDENKATIKVNYQYILMNRFKIEKIKDESAT